MKKIYKLLIIYNIDEEECEVLRETVDVVKTVIVKMKY